MFRLERRDGRAANCRAAVFNLYRYFAITFQ